MQCALASLTHSRPFKRALFPDSVNLLQKKKTDTIKEDRKNQTGNKMIYLWTVFRSQIEEADQALKYTMIYMGRSLNPLFVTLQEIDKSKGWKSSLELVEIQHVDIILLSFVTLHRLRHSYM